MNKLTFQKNAKYAFTVKRELEKNLMLEPGEKLTNQERIRFYGSIFSQMGYLAITNRRVGLIKHFQFRPDVFYSIGWSDIKRLKMVASIEIPHSFLSKTVNSFNQIFDGHYQVIGLNDFYFFSWNYKAMYNGLGWKASDRKTTTLYEKLKAHLK